MMKPKNLIIDGQIFQTEARDRGMGRYSARLVDAILAQDSYETVDIVLTKNKHTNTLTEERARQMFQGANLTYLDLLDTSKTKIEKAERHNKRAIEDYIQRMGYEPAETDFLIPSPFQEPVVSVYPDGVKRVVVFYDLIPYLYHFRYESVMPFKDYLKRFRLLFDADLILAISHSVKDDLIVYLGIPEARITAIDGAPIKSEEDEQKPRSFDVPQHYILMPTSDDPRKNNLRAVLGFEEFRALRNIDYKLVVTSKIHQSERDRLSIFSKNIIFTGNISESELDWLYARASVVLFVPESEGLGLPILEGVLAKRRVVCSSLSVFKEISADGFYFCNHEDQHSIAQALTDALAGDNSKVPAGEYERILEHYSWIETGKRSVAAIADTAHRQTKIKPRIAMLIPRPDGLSAVGKVVAEGHAELSELFEVDYYAEEGDYPHSTRPNFLPYIANYYNATTFSAEKYATYDAVIYHIGNSDYHAESIMGSLYLPGYVILHDTNIGEAYRILKEKSFISAERVELEELIDKKQGAKMSSYIGSICARQLGVLVHSRYAQKAVKEVLPELGNVRVAELATNTPLMSMERDYSHPVVGLAGIIADIKGIAVIESIASDARFDTALVKLFGYNFADEATIKRLREYRNVSVSTNLTDFDFTNSMRKLDVFVNYRMRYQGETSLSTLEALRQGVVVIVRDIGWYSELPDDVVIKVKSTDDVLEKLAWLISNPQQMEKISKRAVDYMQHHHSAAAYASALQKTIDDTSTTNQRARVAAGVRTHKIKSADQLINTWSEK